MAGNTKLLGFLPGNAVQIERWGKKLAVGLTKESMINLRNAVTGLPTKPPEQKDDSDSFNVRYDERVGRVRVDMDTETAHFVAGLLTERITPHPETVAVLNNSAEERIWSWVHSLRAAVRAHEDYHNAQGEPGVQDTH